MTNPHALEYPENLRALRAEFLFAGQSGMPGLLCVHGFTGSPYEVKPLGAYFAARGWRVHGLVLPGHGGLPEGIHGLQWRVWPQAAQTALDDLSQRCDDVYVAGLSMGGLVTARLALAEQTRPGSKLRAIALLATPDALYQKAAQLARVGKYLIPWFYPLKAANLNDPNVRNRLSRTLGDAFDLSDPEIAHVIKNGIRLPTAAIHELLKFIDSVRADLPNIFMPAFVAQGRRDQTVARNSADVIHARLRSQRKLLRWYDDFDHEMPLEPGAELLFADIAAFFANPNLPS